MRFNKSSAKPRATMETHKRSASTSTTPVKKIRLSPVRLIPVIASLSPRVMEHMRVFRTTRVLALRFHGCTWFGTTLIKAHNVNT